MTIRNELFIFFISDELFDHVLIGLILPQTLEFKCLKLIANIQWSKHYASTVSSRS
jgi:hypothetical protein